MKPKSPYGQTITMSLVVALIVGAAVLLTLGLRGSEFEGRVGLIASPTSVPSDTAGAQAQFGEVVSLGLPALVELARSPSVLQTAAAAVPGAPGPAQLAEDVTVELVPASGLARVSVRADSAERAATLTQAMATAMIQVDILAPVAQLRILDPQADVRQVSPDWPLAIGLALAAAVMAGVAGATARHVLRLPASADPVLRQALSEAGCRRPVAILRGEDPGLASRISTLQQAAARPVRVVAVGPGLSGRVESLSRELSTGEVVMQVNGDAARAGVVVVMDGHHSQPEELTATVSALPPASVLVAVVLA